ncbi:hypothetical protein ACJX0J_026922, partial [Zea mays]
TADLNLTHVHMFPRDLLELKGTPQLFTCDPAGNFFENIGIEARIIQIKNIIYEKNNATLLVHADSFLIVWEEKVHASAQMARLMHWHDIQHTLAMHHPLK